MKLSNIIGIVFLSLFTLSSCGGKSSNNSNNENDKLQEAEGYYKDGDKKYKIFYGGIFRINETSNFKNLFPHAMIDAVSTRIAQQVYQGLYKFNQLTLQPELCLAESVEVNDDATVWTIKVKKSVYFQDNECFKDGKGREMTAKDVKYCFDMLCESRSDNTNYGMLTQVVEGARTYYDQTKSGNKPTDGVAGIELIDDNTIRITLNHSYAGFVTTLAHYATWIFPKEAYDKYGSDMKLNLVGTGPFYVDNIDQGTQVRLKKNPSYWEKDENGNKLPYLDIIKITFTKDKKSELANFRKNNLDMVWKLPVDEMESVLVGIDQAAAGGNPEFKYQQINGLVTDYYAFNADSKVFADKNVRIAFNLAVDKESLIKYTMKGEGDAADHGLVPNMPLYDNSDIVGFSYDPDQAKRLMAEAGYPGGKGFPKLTLYLNEGGNTNTIIANAIYNNLKDNIGVEINIEPLPNDILIERFSTGQTDFTRTGWVADIPTPADFLKTFYGKDVPSDPKAKSLPNVSRYKNPIYDEYYEKAMSSTDDATRLEYFKKCDRILIEDAAFLPLFHHQYIRLVQNNVVGFPINAMEYRDLSRVFKTKE